VALIQFPSVPRVARVRHLSVKDLRNNLLSVEVLDHGIPAQVEFESQILKPVFHFIGSRVETRRFQAMGQLD
jgi:hypothetical protein